MRPGSQRGGYAMALALLFIVLFFGLWGVAYRQTAAALRAASAQSQRVVRDEGSTQALARGLTLLETGQPPSDPYACLTVVTTSSGPRPYTVTYTSEGPNAWAIHAAPAPPGDTAPAMPTVFPPKS